MPLSKSRNRDRMRQIRLHASKKTGYVQPREGIVSVHVCQTPDCGYVEGLAELLDVKPNSPYKTVVTDTGELVEFDADGNRIYEEG